MPDAVSFPDQVAHLATLAPALLSRALRTGGRYGDLFYERTIHHRVTWRQQAHPAKTEPPRHDQRGWRVEGVGFHVLGAAAAGFAATATLAPDDLAATAEAASAQLGQAAAARKAASLRALSMGRSAPFDAPDAVSLLEKAALVQAAAEAALSLDACVSRVEVAYQDRMRRALIATSEGALRAVVSMLFGLRVEVVLAVGSDTVRGCAETGGAGGFGQAFAYPPEAVARAAVEQARRLVDARPLRPGTMPVVLAGGWGGVWLHEAVGHLLEADTLSSGEAPFAGRRDEVVASPAVTLYDDATLPGGRGTQAFDDEGTPAARTTLIEDGVLRHYLTDGRTAHQLGLPRTGNARRQDYRHPPLPRMTNLLLAAGNAAPGDLIAGVADGLYVAAVGRGRVAPDGRFAFDVLEGYRIEHGRCTTPVTGLRIVGRGPEVLGNVVGIGRDLQVETARGLCEKAGQVVPVSLGMPTVLIRAMQVERGSG